MLARRSQVRMRGDTIVEVLFAITIFSMVAVASISIMNQGVAVAQRALEINLVRQQIDTQAETLRYLNQLYVADYGKQGAATDNWEAMIRDNEISKTQVQSFEQMINERGECSLPVNKPFTLDSTKIGSGAAAVLRPTSTPATYAKVRYDAAMPVAEGVWIQAVRSDDTGTSAGFYDFHIRACWSSPGQKQPMTLGTIVRLYEPRG